VLQCADSVNTRDLASLSSSFPSGEMCVNYRRKHK